jgi:hypothetical protein
MRILRILAVAGTTGLVAMSGGLAQSPETSQPSSEALQAARNPRGTGYHYTGRHAQVPSGVWLELKVA